MNEWIFGFHAVEGVVKREPRRIRELWLLDSRRDKRIQSLEQLAVNQGVSLRRVDRVTLESRVSGRHQGVAAEVSPSTSDQLLDENGLITRLEQEARPLVLVLDGVTDPHNLGACLRSAEAAGVHAVVMPKDRSAELNAVARKVASGAAESVPLLRVTNLVRTLEKLKAAGLWVVGTTGQAEGSLYEQDLSGPIAMVMGAEGAGMRRLTAEACDFLVNLPMAGAVSSLNVSVATGVCLFECVRQRGLDG